MTVHLEDCEKECLKPLHQKEDDGQSARLY